MTDEKKSYRVTDRRHFTPDGESVATDSRNESPAEAASPTLDAEPPRSESAEMPTVSRVPEPGAVPPGHAPADFITFVMSLATQASVLLRGVEGAPPDFNGAKWLISILEMLRDKTEGRRTAEETEVLDTILYELRMAYVAHSRAGGA